MSEFFFCVRVLHLPGHQRREFWEINGAVSVGIHSVDHVLQLSLCRILIEDRMTVPNSLVVKVLVAIFVERGKGFLELCSLLRQFQHGILCSEQSASLSESLTASFCLLPRLPLVRQLLFLQLPGTAELCSANPSCCTHMTF